MGWLAVHAVYVGLLSFLDVALFSYLAFGVAYTASELGLANAAWSAVFVLSNAILSPLADRGVNRGLLALSFLSLTGSLALFVEGGKVLTAVAYCLHALATASANLAASASVVELLDSEQWSRAFVTQRLALYGVRGVSLVVLAMVGPSKGLVASLAVAVAIGAAGVLLTPPVGLPLQRKLHLMIRSIEGMIAKANGWLLSGSFMNPLALPNPRWSLKGYQEVFRPLGILASVFFVVALGDYVLVCFVKRLTGVVPYDSFLLMMGAASMLIGPTLPLAYRLSSAGPASAALLAALRGALFLSLATRVNTLALGTLFMALSLTLFLLVDTVLYSMYVEATSGYRFGGYFVARELGSMVGGILGGLSWDRWRNLYPWIAFGMILLTLASIAFCRRKGP